MMDTDEPTVPLRMFNGVCDIADLLADALRFYAQGGQDNGGFARDALMIATSPGIQGPA